MSVFAVPVRAWVGSAILGAVVGLPRSSVAAEPCPISLLPESADSAWRAAVDEANAHLAAFEGPHDCRAVEVTVRPDGRATLAFLTKDGRGAARALEAPGELVPTLDALLVTLPGPAPAPPLAPTPTEPERAVAPDAVSMFLPAELTPAPEPPALPLRLLVALTAGGRLALVPETYIAPAVALRPSVALGPWEFGVLADLSPWYEPLAIDKPEGFAAWSLAIALFAGRRESLGALELGYGLTVGVATASIEADDDPAFTTPRTLDLVQARLGAVGRLVYPADTSARFVVDLGFDAAITNLRHGTSQKRGLPDLPRLGLLLAPGIEVSVL